MIQPLPCVTEIDDLTPLRDDLYQWSEHPAA